MSTKKKNTNTEAAMSINTNNSNSNSATLNQLREQIAQLESEKTALHNAAQNSVAIANFSLDALSNLELRVLQSPAIQKLLAKNRNITTLWVLFNSSLIKDIITIIVETIKKVKEKIEEIRRVVEEANKTKDSK